jgi:23S rRNA-/tRNA-specific pseudouridylate synthase
VELGPHYSLAACRPLTGRKHQIRRHAALAGHPVVGDRRYGTTRALRFVRNRGFTRLALHAHGLRFVPPGGDAPVLVQTADLPRELRALLDSDQGHVK